MQGERKKTLMCVIGRVGIAVQVSRKGIDPKIEDAMPGVQIYEIASPYLIAVIGEIGLYSSSCPLGVGGAPTITVLQINEIAEESPVKDLEVARSYLISSDHGDDKVYIEPWDSTA